MFYYMCIFSVCERMNDEKKIRKKIVKKKQKKLSFFLCVVYLLLNNKGLRAGAPLAVVLVAYISAFFYSLLL